MSINQQQAETIKHRALQSPEVSQDSPSSTGNSNDCSGDEFELSESELEQVAGGRKRNRRSPRRIPNWEDPQPKYRFIG